MRTVYPDRVLSFNSWSKHIGEEIRKSKSSNKRKSKKRK